jgi:hypothetical protein
MASFALGLALVTGSMVSTTTAATLLGRLVNGSGSGPGKAELVELMDLTQGMVPMATLKNVEGDFRFEDVPEASPAHFLLRVTSNGVAYTHRVASDSFDTPMEIPVYDTSSDLSDIKVSVHDVLFQRNGDHMQATELLQFTNETDPPRVITPEAQPIRVHIPHDIHGDVEASVGTGSMPLKVDLLETDQPDIYTVDHALQPGDTRLVVRYLLSYENETVAWSPTEIYPTEERRVLVSPPDVKVEAEGMIPSTDEAPKGFEVYVGLPLEAGQSWAVNLSGGSAQSVDPHANEQGGPSDVQDVRVQPNRLDASRAWIFGGLALIFLCAIGFAATTAASSDDGARKNPERDKLSRLADRYVSGEIDRQTFEAQRDRLLAGHSRKKSPKTPANAAS